MRSFRFFVRHTEGKRYLVDTVSCLRRDTFLLPEKYPKGH